MPLVIGFGKFALAVLLLALLASQCRKPSLFIGRGLARIMNASHASLTRWGLSHAAIGPGFTMLDVGCGGGRTIETLASTSPGGKVFGIDYSADSVAVARARNSSSIAAGRVDIRQGSVSRLPFPDATFDLVTAVETHYYWPDLPRDVREIRRVLQPGGTLLIIAETYRGRSIDWLYLPVMRLLLRASYLTEAEHRQLLVDAGFRDVEVFTDPSHGWICARGRSRLEMA